MKIEKILVWVSAALLGLSSLSAQAAVIDLYSYSLNIDGDVSDVIDAYDPLDPVPAGVDVTGFDDIAGLGMITATITGVGDHNFVAFFDHEIDEFTNTFFNESGAVVGTPAAGQSWEIDEPGYGTQSVGGSGNNGTVFNEYIGDIYANFSDSDEFVNYLDNDIFYDWFDDQFLDSNTDDVSMAMGWNFTLAADEIAEISLSLSESQPASGFYLAHIDPDSNGGAGAGIYLSSTLTISTIPVPEPAMVLLFGIGLAGMTISRRRVNANS